MSRSAITSKNLWKWSCWAAVIFTLLFCVGILPNLVRKARLISHVDEVGGFFYSYHSLGVRKLLGKNFYKVKAFVNPKLEPFLGRNWPGIFKEITHVEIDLRNGGTEWDLKYLRHQQDLKWVDIGRLPVKNSELEALETLPSLVSLCVNISNLDAEGIEMLAELRGLRGLYLRGREITEEEAKLISTLKDLSYLSLIPSELEEDQTRVIEIFEERLPDCKILTGGYFSP